jgi:hypothetical protein
MTIRLELNKSNRANQRDSDAKTKLFYLFLIAQICAIFCMVVGILFFILRLSKII